MKARARFHSFSCSIFAVCYLSSGDGAAFFHSFDSRHGTAFAVIAVPDFWRLNNMNIKKYLTVFSLLCVMVGVLPANPAQAAGKNKQTYSELQLASVHAVVYDLEAGREIYSKNADTPVPIASITKLMTAMVVLDAGLPLDELISVNSEDRDLIKHTFSRVRMGSKLSRREMLKLALMSSENRAASALGRHYPGGRHMFVQAMNEKARRLGMHNTYFADSTGLSSENISTAADLVKLVKAASQYPLIREFTTAISHEARFQNPRYRLSFVNTNSLVRKDRWEILLSKTGYTREAGRCLVMVANIDHRPVVMVLLDSYGKLTPVGDAGRVKTWMETGVITGISAEAKNYQRERYNQRLSVAANGNNQG